MSDESEHLIEQEEALTMSMFLNKRDLEMARLRQALDKILRMRKLDACAAASMQAIARSALSSHHLGTENG